MIKESIPNTLTIARFFLASYFPVANPEYRILIVIVSLLTEFLDGQFSRVLKAETELGQLLDPIADKVFVISVVFTLIFENKLFPYEFTLVALRDISVMVGAIYLMGNKDWQNFKTFPPRILGKITTCLQYIFMFYILIYARQTPGFEIALFSTTIISAVSAFDYMNIFVRKINVKG